MQVIELCETMAENYAEREPDLLAVFDDSGDEGSFDGFDGT